MAFIGHAKPSNGNSKIYGGKKKLSKNPIPIFFSSYFSYKVEFIN